MARADDRYLCRTCAHEHREPVSRCEACGSRDILSLVFSGTDSGIAITTRVVLGEDDEPPPHVG